MRSQATIPDSADAILAAALRARGQRVTPQRLAVARALRDLDRHATAEQVFGAVSARLPGVSLPTIYATLGLLAELGVVRRIPTESGTVLYDPRACEHQHLSCRRCAEVIDVDVEIELTPVLAAARAHGFEPDAPQVVVSGLCERCAAAG